MQRKRHVRLHLIGELPSLEGLLVSYSTRRTGNHYVLELAAAVESPDTTHTLEGPAVRVPREHVAFIQELS